MHDARPAPAGRALYVREVSPHDPSGHDVPGPDPSGHDFSGLRADLDLPAAHESDDFADDVLGEAVAISRAAPAATTDLTDLAFVTIDPPGSLDLDQAVLVERDGDGFTVRYAIADLGSAITPGGPIDVEARRRGQTIYLPDGRIPLHPPILSEDALSLLPDQVRGAAVWSIEVAADGSIRTATVQRALVRSVARLDYAGAQADVDDGTPHPSIEALADLGRLRRKVRLAAGAIDLALPEQSVVADGDDWTLRIEPRTEVDGWNAEVSLLTGMAAAEMMVAGGVGLLRTLPRPPAEDVAAFMAVAAGLGVSAPADASPGQVLAALDPSRPASMALMTHATALLRGAGYEVVDGDASHDLVHAGVGGLYAHVTAPLRRLADRFGTEACLAVSAGVAVPTWVGEALPQIAEAMSSSGRRVSQAERAAIDLVETWVMQARRDEELAAIVVKATDHDAEILITDPPIEARCAGQGLVDGSTVMVRVHDIDTAARVVTYDQVVDPL